MGFTFKVKVILKNINQEFNLTLPFGLTPPTGPRTGGVLRAAPAVGPRALRPCPLPDRLLRSLRQRVGPKGAAPLDNTPTPAPLGPPAVPPMEGRPIPPIKPTLPFEGVLPLETVVTAALLSHHESGLKFSPIVRNGQIISLEVTQKIKGNNTRLLTVKDSFKLLPGALAKLASDFRVGQQKDHFPHYFLLNTLEETMEYVGPLPAYKFFEPKRTSREEWEEMFAKTGNTWSFMEIARKYLHSDCVCLHQVISAFFLGLHNQFQLNPITNLSIPGVAFKAWKQHQLPLLHSDGLGVQDLSKSLDNHFRAAYHGGIVDVYKPHLEGQGFYYDVNSLYPTAMCRPMPVGQPTLVSLTMDQFEGREFFGYLWARVQAPETQYIGLLPIKYQGRLVCPVGIFEGLFFLRRT